MARSDSSYLMKFCAARVIITPDVPAKLVQSVANQQRKAVFTNVGVSLILMAVLLGVNLAAYGLTGAYLVLVSVVSAIRRKRQIAELDALIADVKRMVDPL